MQKISIAIFAALAATTVATAGTYKSGRFTIDIDKQPAAVTITNASGDTIIANNLPQWGVTERDSTQNSRYSMADATGVKVKRTAIDGMFGKGEQFSVRGKYGQQTIEQTYDIYPDFIITQLAVESPDSVSLNYLAPIYTSTGYDMFDRAGNYTASIPYDNDAWVRYISSAFGSEHRESYEVRPMFNADTRSGVVIGSIDHKVWKSAINLVTTGATRVDTLEVYSGAATTLTRDVRPHGKLTGKRVESARMIIIPTDDWRDGMELFADQCALVAPKIKSLGGRPFGWNSWGKLAKDITFQKAIEVSDFIHDNIQHSFHDEDSTLYIDLDAFWDFGFKPHQHKEFVEHCRANGQRPGIYTSPFADWGNNPNAVVREAPEYKMGELYLRNNGKPIKFDGAPALDPTHPGTKAKVRAILEKVIEWGYEYIKIDCMAHGAYESDHHYDPAVTTGNQAYAQGMEFINSVIDGRMWINLSIAPLFPANYAHSRRISCDAWADIKNTEYVLNALTYGWWLDHVYHYNDADHIVYEGATDGENRARVTSSALTGVYFLGDDMSASGAAKDRVVRNTTNDELNEMARRTDSFRPIEFGVGDKAADMFVNEDDEYIYVAIFNFSPRAVTKTLPLRRIGLSESAKYSALEIWSHDEMTLSGQIVAQIPSKDVKVYRIKK